MSDGEETLFRKAGKHGIIIVVVKADRSNDKGRTKMDEPTQSSSVSKWHLATEQLEKSND